jgi:multidrug efflux pump
MIIYAVIVAAMSLLFLRMPTAFLPDEGQGFMYSMVQLPVGATRQRTLKVLEIIEHPFLEEQKEAVESLFTVPGGGGE